ncbi:MFS transporter [Novosphingobium sp. 1949]|uniref:MFS transporter n=1 Tax=Novosphingobium organovorum TaxID=2930092 RepID=A0ABT0BG66_9SPHN|nr:MFS transporter [Novosphingobium organovorum]MCJ2183796.1 MFS transporter [Novosphingobium organovorum]
MRFYDRFHDSRLLAVAPAIVIAALAILQPGIDPVFLALLTKAHGLSPHLHGWIVSATQAGLAAGSLTNLVAGSRLAPRAAARLCTLCALLALGAAAATAWTASFAALLAVRALFGLAMGVLYTQAMTHAARHSPTASFALVLLLQLLLSTFVALGLPVIGTDRPALALALLALAPLGALALLARARDPLGVEEERGTLGLQDERDAPDASPHARAGQQAERTAQRFRESITPPVALLASALFCYVCASMIVWSLTGAMAIAARFPPHVLGTAVAVGSLAGAITSLAVLRERVRVDPRITALACGIAMLTPVLGARLANETLFIAAIVAFNVGNTAIFIRCSGFAARACRTSGALRFVSCANTAGMIAGPAIGSSATTLAGPQGPLYPAALALALGCLTLWAWHYRQRRQNLRLVASTSATAARAVERRQAA